MEVHDAANIFPIDDEHIHELAVDILANGQRVPIELLDGKIIDGRRRFQACQLAGVEPKCVAVSVADPVAYVLSMNLQRRHLTPSQLAMVGARATSLREKAAADAKERQKRKPADSVRENLPEQRARDEIGKAVGVSGKTIDHATRVIEQGVPELAQAVDEGRMAVSTAAILASEPPEVQREEINQPKRRRVYAGGTKEEAKREEKAEKKPAGEVQGVGTVLAHEAINSLSRIPKNDALRKRGFQLVTDWIKHNP